MIIGVPSEVKNNENRIGMTPDSVSKLTKKGHEVFVQESAGANIGFFDQDFISAGAKILKTPEDVYKSSEMIVKVKEPIPSEYKFLRDDLTLFTYLHLAGDPQNAKKLIDTGVTGIAYETVTSDNGSMPLLAPMSTIAGQLAFTVGTYHLLKTEQIHQSIKYILYFLIPIHSRALIIFFEMSQQLLHAHDFL